jgi:predicted DNA-binding transcriptional regulator AlpA
MAMTATTKAHSDYLDALLPEEEAAEFLGYSKRALQNWRHRGDGPPYIRISERAVRYRRRDLIRWCEELTEQSTSSY